MSELHHPLLDAYIDQVTAQAEVIIAKVREVDPNLAALWRNIYRDGHAEIRRCVYRMHEDARKAAEKLGYDTSGPQWGEDVKNDPESQEALDIDAHWIAKGETTEVEGA